MSVAQERGLVTTIKSLIKLYIPPFLQDDLVYRELAETPLNMDADFPSRMFVWEV